MIRRIAVFECVTVAAMLLSTAMPARGDDGPKAKAPPADTPPVKLTIYPAPAPRPSLKYHLLPDLKIEC